MSKTIYLPKRKRITLLRLFVNKRTCEYLRYIARRTSSETTWSDKEIEVSHDRIGNIEGVLGVKSSFWTNCVKH